jgi:hypothetical protein
MKQKPGKRRAFALAAQQKTQRAKTHVLPAKRSEKNASMPYG